MIHAPPVPASSPTDGPFAPLAAWLEAHGPALSIRALDRMYQDPFWWARFGERGRRFAEEDALYHVTYLVHALRLASPEPLAHYARWLQRVLTTRGMCSRHLADDWGCLAAEITAADARELPGGHASREPALAYLREAQGALVYTAPAAARALQLAAEPLAAAAAARLDPAAPHADGALARDALSHLVSYLADALALERPAVFADHARFAAGFYTAQHGRAPGFVAALLTGLDQALADGTASPALDSATAQAARAVLTSARAT